MLDLYQVNNDLMISFFHTNNRICFSVLLKVKTMQKKEVKLLQEQKK